MERFGIPRLAVIISLAVMVPYAVHAQETSSRPSAASIFEETLAGQGLAAAEARLREVLDDTTGTYSADPLELMRRLPARLTRQGQRTAALNLLELLGDYMGDVPHYWQDGGWTAPEIIHLIDERLGIPPTGQPALSPDGKYIFFCLCGDIYWADAGFLAELDPN